MKNFVILWLELTTNKYSSYEEESKPVQSKVTDTGYITDWYPRQVQFLRWLAIQLGSAETELRF